jgi:hypothetical protein
MLCLNVNKEFAKYFQHFALNSWGGEQRKYFENNEINYCEKYNVKYKIG